MYVSGMRHLYSSTADVLRVTEIQDDDGFVTGLQYVKVGGVIDALHGVAGELPCRLDLAIVRKGSKAAIQAALGKAVGRSGTLFCDVTDGLLAGDRLKMHAGSSVIGTFEVRSRPDVVATPFGGVGHIEADILEVTKPGSKAAGTFEPLASIATGSQMRHLYNSRIAIYRKNNSGVFTKITDVPDAILGVAGEAMCHLAIGLVRPNAALQMPIPAGRVADRTAVLICDATQYIQADDRVKVISGPNLGVFEVRQTPDTIQGYGPAHHIEVEVIEVVKSIGADL